MKQKVTDLTNARNEFPVQSDADASGGTGLLITYAVAAYSSSSAYYTTISFYLEEAATLTVWMRSKLDNIYNYNLLAGFDTTNISSLSAMEMICIVDFIWKSVAVNKFFTVGGHALVLAARRYGVVIEHIILITSAETPEDMSDNIMNDDTYTLKNHSAGDAIPALPLNAHLQLLVIAEDIPAIRARLTHPENITAYKAEVKEGVLTQSCIFPDKNSNRNEDPLNYLENKAFLYIVKADTTDEANEKYV